MKRWVLALAGLVLIAKTASAGAHSVQVPPEASGALKSFLQSINPSAVLEGPLVMDCTLSGGTKAKCIKVILTPVPQRSPGPWCPNHVSDGPEAGGFWIADGKVFDVDGAFVKDLAAFYKDPKWKLYDPKTGEIKVTRSFEACFAAARPNVPEEYYDYCVQCEVDQVVTAPSATFFIPLEPVRAKEPSPLRDMPGAGVALNGVRLNGPAPYDEIVKARNIAPFDPCGGHVNPYAGYHYHFATDCIDGVDALNGHAQQIGISVDGYGIYRRLNTLGEEAKGLDRCRGHSHDGLPYHYHAAPVGTNSIVGCISGEMGCVVPTGTQSCDASLARQPMHAPGAMSPPGGG